MIEIRPASPEDLPQIVELLGNANDTPYDLARVAEEKCFGAGVAGPPHTLIATTHGVLAGLVVACGSAVRILAVHRDHRRKSLGSALLREAEKWIETTGGRRVNLGAEPGNYFVPGIPQNDEGMHRFFHLQGYEKLPEEAVDLSVELSSHPKNGSTSGDSIRRAALEDRGPALQFVEEGFGKAWRLECERTFEHAEPTMFLAEKQGRLVGFSAHDANNRGLGFFGPEGVLPEARGQGLGRLLLLASLSDLRSLGFKRTIIAWAASHDFYQRVCGAAVAHRFIRMRKVLG